MPCAVPGVAWASICYFSARKKGDYGAPPGMLFMQQKAEMEKEKSLLKDNESSRYSEESTRDNYAKLTPRNIHMLNFEDTEEAPGSEDLDQCNMFDNDIDKMPLF
jgi:hypothetical protein